jgi:protein-arginine kinase activator protein McsA
MGAHGQENTCSCGIEEKAKTLLNVEIDEDMSKRRELNAQMRIAVENEEFEKAAELRDKIKELEARM